MKKIFAFILATIMVLSLVPASAFAAVSNCPDKHTVAICDALDISYTAIDKVDPSCTVAGGIVYECDRCGVQFVDDFVEALGHIKVDDPDNEDVAPKCKKKSNGDPSGDNGKDYWICVVCGEEGMDVIPYNHESVHKLEPVSGKVGCEAQYKCKTCGKQGYLSEDGALVSVPGHKWEFESITVEPVVKDGVYDNGEACFVCTVCHDAKYVPIINPGCGCYNPTKLADPKEATCDEDGNTGLYFCEVCLTYYTTVDANGKGVTKLTDRADDDDEVINEEDAIIPALAHTWDEDKTEEIGCSVKKYCEECEKWYTISDKTTHRAIHIDYQQSATCTTWGYISWVCIECGAEGVEMIEPGSDGHELEPFSIDPSCANKGYEGYYCTTCVVTNTSGKTEGVNYFMVNGIPHKVVKYTEFAAVASAHVIVTEVNGVTYTKEEYNELTCDQKSDAKYIIWHCANGCTTYGYQVEKNESAHDLYISVKVYNCGNRPTHIIGTEELIWACTKCDYTATEIKEATAPTVYDSIEEAYYYHTAYRYVTRYIDADNDGEKEFVSSYEPIAAYIDAVDLKVKAEATCKQNGYATIECDGCKADGIAVIAKDSNGHVANADGYTAKVNSTCKGDDDAKQGTYGYYVCKFCNAKFDYNADGTQITFTDSTIKVPYCETRTKHTYESANSKGCTEAHYYKCTTCKTTYTTETGTSKVTVTDDFKGHSWKTLVSGINANCGEDGRAAVRYCQLCNVINIYAKWDNANSAGDKTQYISETRTKKAVKYSDEGTIEVTLNTGLVVTIFEGKIDVEDEDNAEALFVPRNNHQNGWTVNADGYTFTGTLIAPYGSSTKNDDHTTVNYVHEYCKACNYEYLRDYAPATGHHMNKKGELLVTNCANETVTDRYCVLCNTTIPAHNLSESFTQGVKDCVESKYTYAYCLDCGARVLTNTDLADAEWYHNKISKNNYAGCEWVGTVADYAGDGSGYYVCDVCKVQLSEVIEGSCPGKGVEFVLSTDSDAYVLGNTIYLTVSIDSFKGVNVWGMDFCVTYNPFTVEFLSEETTWVSENFTVGEAGEVKTWVESEPDEDGKTSWSKVPTGTIKVALNAEENVLVKGSEDLVVLAFKVIAPAAHGETFRIPAFAEEVVSTRWGTSYTELIDAVSVIDEKGRSVNALYNEWEPEVFEYTYEDFTATNPAPVEPKREDFVYYADYQLAVAEWEKDVLAHRDAYMKARAEEQLAHDAAQIANGLMVGETKIVEFKQMLDVNGDERGGNNLTIADIHALYDLIVHAEYDVAADTNFDNIINMLDLANAYNVLVGNTDVETLAGVLPSDWFPAMGARND